MSKPNSSPLTTKEISRDVMADAIHVRDYCIRAAKRAQRPNADMSVAQSQILANLMVAANNADQIISSYE